MIELTGKVAVITGAGSGIGRATALLMASRGAKVLLADINLDSAKAVAGEIEKAGGNACPFAVDVSQESQIEGMVEEAVSLYGRLDILHNNAALLDPVAFTVDLNVLTMDSTTWDRVMAVNVRSVMLGCKFAIPKMITGGGGSIINTASMYGEAAYFEQVAYGSSKAAVAMLTQYVAVAFGKQRIRCNAVAPSVIRTPGVLAYFPEGFLKVNEEASLLPYMGEPEDVASVVAFLASDDARFVTGQTIRVDGGTLSQVPTVPACRREFADVIKPK